LCGLRRCSGDCLRLTEDTPATSTHRLRVPAVKSFTVHAGRCARSRQHVAVEEILCQEGDDFLTTVIRRLGVTRGSCATAGQPDSDFEVRVVNGLGFTADSRVVGGHELCRAHSHSDVAHGVSDDVTDLQLEAGHHLGVTSYMVVYRAGAAEEVARLNVLVGR